ncbi:MAG: hypothetical protein AAF629_17010, partial [Chloroflexota bacterium]
EAMVMASEVDLVAPVVETTPLLTAVPPSNPYPTSPFFLSHSDEWLFVYQNLQYISLSLCVFTNILPPTCYSKDNYFR